MAKVDLRLRPVVAPSLVVVATAFDDEGQADACTLAFCTMSGHKPPCVTISINATARRKTLKSILARRTFGVSFPSVAQMREADYLGVESGYNIDKLAACGLTFSHGHVLDVPVVDQFPVTLECALVASVTYGSHMQLTGEIKNILAEDSVLDERGMIVLEKSDPIFYDEETRTYFRMGERIGDAFAQGAELRRQLGE